MIDIENLVFTKVATALRTAFPGPPVIFVSGEYIACPSSFPAVTIVEDDNETYLKSLDSNMTENHATIMYTVNGYSNLASGKKAQCKSIMALIDTQILSMGLTRVGCGPTAMPNADTSIYRMVARYQGVVSAKTINGDATKFQIYRR